MEAERLLNKCPRPVHGRDVKMNGQHGLQLLYAPANLQSEGTRISTIKKNQKDFSNCIMIPYITDHLLPMQEMVETSINFA